MDRVTRLPARQVLHIDFDSFFASVEQQNNPLFRNKPLGVTAANGRTCIIASSREAKVLGIKTGDRTYEALRICPSIIFVSSDFVKYFEISKKFLNICKDYSPYVELFSIDEVFMDITKTTHLFGGAFGIIEKIKTRIRKEIGEYITASIGVSYNKLLAKLASGLKKPNGVFEIKKEDVETIYKNAKLTSLCGIGERIKERLNKIGIYTLLELRDIGLPLLISEFGKAEANFLKNIGLAIDDSPIVSYTIAPIVKSISRNYCLPKNEYDKKVILQNLYELCEEVALKLRRLRKKARTVGVALSGDINIHMQKTYEEYFDTGKEIFDVCIDIIGKKKNSYVRQISVRVSSLEDKEATPLSLFDNNYRKDRVQITIDKINDRFGDYTIRNGFLMHADRLKTVPNGYMADKFERTKLALSQRTDEV